MALKENTWINVQQKTFTKWLNTKVSARQVSVNNLVEDLSDGVILIHLLELLGGESLGRYAARPKLRVQRFENVNIALDYVRARSIQLTNIGAEDVVDGNRKIILGLIWMLILRFTISDINEEGMTAKEGLLLWCQRKTACYDDIEIKDFSTSWNDGLAFCALLDIHRPDLIDYDALDKSDHRGNMKRAFELARREIGIPDLLDVEDVCDVARPDERSLMTYIAYWFHAFSRMEKVETAGRRVEKFVQTMQGTWEMQHAFERRMRALLDAVERQQREWAAATFEGTYADAKAQLRAFTDYKVARKRDWIAEKSDLATLLGNIRTKLGTYRLRAYEPPRDLALDALDRAWAALLAAERARSHAINATIRAVKDALRKSFADKANDLALTLSTLALALSGLEGDVEDQTAHAQRLHANLPPLDAYLEGVQELDKRCAEASIEDNDLTPYTADELAYELALVRRACERKLAFLANQRVARAVTNLTPAQLEEFESVFRHFDREARNALRQGEFEAALASLGYAFEAGEMETAWTEASGGKRDCDFEGFIRFMVNVTEDQFSAEQVYKSFREVADGKPYVTEVDLRHSLIPDELIDDLTRTMPAHHGPDLRADRGRPQYDYISFMERMIDDSGSPAEPGAQQQQQKQLESGDGAHNGDGGDRAVADLQQEAASRADDDDGEAPASAASTAFTDASSPLPPNSAASTALTGLTSAASAHFPAHPASAGVLVGGGPGGSGSGGGRVKTPPPLRPPPRSAGSASEGSGSGGYDDDSERDEEEAEGSQYGGMGTDARHRRAASLLQSPPRRRGSPVRGSPVRLPAPAGVAGAGSPVRTPARSGAK